MSRAVRKKVMDVLLLLQESTDHLEKLIEQQNTEDAYLLICDSQECAIAFGTYIEGIYGEGRDCVHALEEYCEALFQLSEASTPESVAVLKESMEELAQQMEQDFPDKKEVVFFPYKASMWDSLESVYLAAREDPDCEAYCVPIPYYDLKEDGSFGEMHYEGGDYPANIRVVDWQTYHFEERRPDEIYIHNPYDNYNIVTSVHPRFYSSNLKKYTDKLVYIPYFVLGEIEPDNQEAIDSMKHFVWTPGVINADRVIVQSEKMKQIYVNEYLKAAEESGLTGEHIDRTALEKKFLGLGSPKFDKIRKTKDEIGDIPAQWLDVIQKPDGSWKKVIFYNTAISGLLEQDEQWVDKIENTLHIFKEKRDDATLLWRPHPLIENTIQTLRPIVKQKYLDIKNRYIMEGWGIYDNTTNLDRAVVLSDAYYGDQSSVVELFQKMGKPVMIQSLDILYGAE